MREFTRREVLKKFYQALVAVGASSFISFEDLLATEKNSVVKPTVIWMHGLSCSGCSASFLNIEDVSVAELITRFVKLVFHNELSGVTGHQVIEIIDELILSNQKYIFVLEGAIPTKLPHACLIGDRPMTYWVDKLASKAELCIAAGTCAVHGGINKMPGTLTGAMTLLEFLNSREISIPLVNLPSCPMKPEHITYTILYFAKLFSLPEIDESLRPKKFFEKSIHERCIYHADFQEDFFAEFVGDKGCLFKLGCQGPTTKNDCFVNGYNDNTNNCIKAGHPCVGCSSENFPRRIMLHDFNENREVNDEV